MKKASNKLLMLDKTEAELICRKENIPITQLPFVINGGAKLAKDTFEDVYYIFGYTERNAEEAYNYYMEDTCENTVTAAADK